MSDGGWTEVDGRLHRELEFADFAEAWAFICQSGVGGLLEHPMMRAVAQAMASHASERRASRGATESRAAAAGSGQWRFMAA